MGVVAVDSFVSIPVVDLSPWRGTDAERAELASTVREVCHRVGFFLLVGHGVDEARVDGWFGVLERFFALPDDVKRRIDKANSPHFRGWEGVGAELTDNRTDFREQLDLSTAYEPHPAGAEPHYLCLDGPNQWLDDAEAPGFRAAVEDFFETMAHLAGELMGVLSVGLGLAPGHLEAVFGERPLSLAKLIRYPTTPAGEAGVNAHHDAGFLTILLQHGVGGLEAQNPDGDWVDVECLPGAFVVNLGEMLQEITRNYFVATTHRVITDRPRLSAVYFAGPDLRTRLDPLPLDPTYADAVVASPRHSSAGFMAKRGELLEGRTGITSTGAGVYGRQLWNYYVRSYPGNVRRHYPDLFVDA